MTFRRLTSEGALGLDYIAALVAYGRSVVRRAAIRDLERVTARILEKDGVIPFVRVRNLRAFDSLASGPFDNFG